MTKKPLHVLKTIALCLLIMPWHGCFGAQENQIKINYGNNKTASIAYNPKKTIAEVKQELVDKTKIPFSKQKLMLLNTTLRNRNTLQKAGVKAGVALTLKQWKKEQELFIKTLTGKTIMLDYDPQDTIEEIKKDIYNKENISPEQQRIIFAGKELTEPNQTLKNYKVESECTLHLVLKLRAMLPANNNITGNNGNNNINTSDASINDIKDNINENNNNNEIIDNGSEMEISDNNNEINENNNNNNNIDDAETTDGNEIKDNNNEIKNNIINPPNDQRNKNKNNEINDNNNNDNNNTTTYVVIALGIIGIIGYIAHNKSTKKPTKARDTSKQAT